MAYSKEIKKKKQPNPEDFNSITIGKQTRDNQERDQTGKIKKRSFIHDGFHLYFVSVFLHLSNKKFPLSLIH